MSARVETEWFGDEARPWDEAWATDIHRGVLHSFKWMAGEIDPYPQFLNAYLAMPKVDCTRKQAPWRIR